MYTQSTPNVADVLSMTTSSICLHVIVVLPWVDSGGGWLLLLKLLHTPCKQTYAWLLWIHIPLSYRARQKQCQSLSRLPDSQMFDLISATLTKVSACVFLAGMMLNRICEKSIL